jgi:hypothetical protein
MTGGDARLPPAVADVQKNNKPSRLSRRETSNGKVNSTGFDKTELVPVME